MSKKVSTLEDEKAPAKEDVEMVPIPEKDAQSHAFWEMPMRPLVRNHLRAHL